MRESGIQERARESRRNLCVHSNRLVFADAWRHHGLRPCGSGRGRSKSRFQDSISAAARGRPGRCPQNIPTCICSGATWGKKISENIAEIRSLAHAHGRECEIGFGMRLQIICREDEEAPWEAADSLVRHASMAISCCHIFGPASPRCDRAPVSRRSAIPSAEMLQQFIDAGCHSFCLSGYLHDEETDQFRRLVRPILAKNNWGRLAA